MDRSSSRSGKRGAGVSGEESEAAEVLAAYKPDYFVSGHDYSFPYASGQNWKMDTESGELSWRAASETWIPEDGLYDHLALKLDKD